MAFQFLIVELNHRIKFYVVGLNHRIECPQFS
uniref:Uncharacterized protein n=1 Tax=Arundo donax TaxID=35708 RepID=A0A0A8ZXW7_ARUDO